MISIKEMVRSVGDAETLPRWMDPGISMLNTSHMTSVESTAVRPARAWRPSGRRCVQPRNEGFRHCTLPNRERQQWV